MNLSTLIILNNERQNELKCRVRSQPLYAHSIRRARKVLLAADEVGYLEIAQRFKVSRWEIIAWHDRFANCSLEAIQSNFPRSGRKPHIDTTAIAQVTTRTKPVGTTRWDTRFVEKLENIVGLYLSPPEHLLVLYYDEKRRAQELGRAQLALPLKKAAHGDHDTRFQTQWHDNIINCAQHCSTDRYHAVSAAAPPYLKNTSPCTLTI